ncbi:MAG: hypothetical protein J6Y38_00280 [Bacteroidaceae bacterium]|nr:hypothetical protein [Bacteroidaceae bacterium]
MKRYVPLLLSFYWCLLIVACKTVQLASNKYEGRVSSTEKADSLTVQDSVLILVYDRKDTVKIIERKIKLRERVKVQHDTLTIIRTDTLVKIVEPTIRSPAKSVSILKTRLYTMFTTIVVFIIIFIILKIKKIWDRLI